MASSFSLFCTFASLEERGEDNSCNEDCNRHDQQRGIVRACGLLCRASHTWSVCVSAVTARHITIRHIAAKIAWPISCKVTWNISRKILGHHSCKVLGKGARKAFGKGAVKSVRYISRKITRNVSCEIVRNISREATVCGVTPRHLRTACCVAAH